MKIFLKIFKDKYVFNIDIKNIQKVFYIIYFSILKWPLKILYYLLLLRNKSSKKKEINIDDSKIFPYRFHFK